jgi:hypothetical protein
MATPTVAFRSEDEAKDPKARYGALHRPRIVAAWIPFGNLVR